MMVERWCVSLASFPITILSPILDRATHRWWQKFRWQTSRSSHRHQSFFETGMGSANSCSFIHNYFFNFCCPTALQQSPLLCRLAVDSSFGAASCINTIVSCSRGDGSRGLGLFQFLRTATIEYSFLLPAPSRANQSRITNNTYLGNYSAR
jgi:hypothetical protein